MPTALTLVLSFAAGVWAWIGLVVSCRLGRSAIRMRCPKMPPAVEGFLAALSDYGTWSLDSYHDDAVVAHASGVALRMSYGGDVYLHKPGNAACFTQREQQRLREAILVMLAGKMLTAKPPCGEAVVFDSEGKFRPEGLN